MFPNSPPFFLWWRASSVPWAQQPIDRPLIIGRGEDADIRIDSSIISRQHARIDPAPQGVWVTDLGSRNGTLLEGRRIPPNTPQLVQPGQRFYIGPMEFCVSTRGDAPPADDAAQTPTADLPAAAPVPPPAAGGHTTDVLWYRCGGGEWSKVALDRPLTLGRGSESDLVIPQEDISRRHIALEVKGKGVLWVTDLGSRNGSFAGDRRLPPNTPQPLKYGQRLRLGRSTEVVYTASGEKPPEAQERPRPAAPPPKPGAQARKGGIGWLAAVLLGGGMLACVCALAFAAGILLLRPHQPAAPPPQLATEIVIAPPTPTTPPPTPTPALPPTPKPDQTWLIMIYQVAEDQQLEYGAFFDISESELIGSSARVHIVTQLDRFDGGLDEPGGWTSAKRLEIASDNDLDRITSPQVDDLDEINSADANQLVDFILWAAETYPADRHVLVLWDHGMGWVGGLVDDTPRKEAVMELNEIEQAIAYAAYHSGIGKFDVIGFDACLMGQIEVFAALAPYADYIVASEETEPMLGWSYGDLFSRLVENPDMSAEALTAAVVEGYIDQDILIVHDELREVIFKGASAEEAAYDKGKNSTLSVVQSTEVEAVLQNLDGFIAHLNRADPEIIAWARTNAQHYEDSFMLEDTPLHESSTIDLAHFAALMKDKSGDPQLAAAADDLIAAIRQAVIAEKHGKETPGSVGISIYFPLSKIYAATYDDRYDLCYTCIAHTFADRSQWPAFLEAYYTR
ncbi:MAG: FHA domain-containing protein [Anaerolineae bacterium]|nr:FHA domain-containing protein [Anaerolineae bacterium]